MESTRGVYDRLQEVFQNLSNREDRERRYVWRRSKDPELVIFGSSLRPSRPLRF